MKKLEKMININELGTILSKYLKIDNVYITKCTLMTDVNDEIPIMARRNREVDVFLGGGSVLNIYYKTFENNNKGWKAWKKYYKKFIKGDKR